MKKRSISLLLLTILLSAKLASSNPIDISKYSHLRDQKRAYKGYGHSTDTSTITIIDTTVDNTINPTVDTTVDPTIVPSTTSSSTSCPQNEIFTQNRGCIPACTDPFYDHCSNGFNVLDNLFFCALTQDGKWKSLSHQCQACASKDLYLGVSNGKCRADEEGSTDPKFIPVLVNNTNTINSHTINQDCSADEQCSAREICQGGICIEDCSRIVCQGQTECQRGQCVATFTLECTIDEDCSDNKLCSLGKCIQDVRKGVVCGYKTCKLYQKCSSGICVDNLSAKRIPRNNKTECHRCTSYQFCNQNGKCINKCSKLRCFENSECFQVECIQIKDIKDQCTIDEQCKESEICTKNKCKQICSRVRCGFGKKCQHGVCVDDVIVEPVDPIDNGFVRCPSQRPDQKTCPFVYYIRNPDKNFCIVDQDGLRREFVRECEICKDKSILKYKNVACKKDSGHKIY